MPATPIHLRPMAVADIAPVSAAFLATQGWGDRSSWFDFAVRTEGVHAVVAVDEDGALIGTGATSIHGTVAWIGSIWVRPDRRGEHIGWRLTEHTIEVAETAGCRTLVLVASEMGRPIYERMGFSTLIFEPVLEVPGLSTDDGRTVATPLDRSANTAAAANSAAVSDTSAATATAAAANDPAATTAAATNAAAVSDTSAATATAAAAAMSDTSAATATAAAATTPAAKATAANAATATAAAATTPAANAATATAAAAATPAANAATATAAATTTPAANAATANTDPDRRIRPWRTTDLDAAAALDRRATGEDRRHLLAAFATPETAFVITGVDDVPRGFVVRAPWGGGATIAPDPDDALALLDARRRVAGPDKVVRAGLMESNLSGLTRLEADGWIENWRARRMIRGEPLDWDPDAIWGQFNHALG